MGKGKETENCKLVEKYNLYLYARFILKRVHSKRSTDNLPKVWGSDGVIIGFVSHNSGCTGSPVFSNYLCTEIRYSD